ncbi:MAG: amidohydrolase family protein [Endomicrobium sp.]|jgi:predicted TIM-barrel fold metal-dependent hydrolase|nr:amidohydrolase family protein [Endomicrobium sp.]
MDIIDAHNHIWPKKVVYKAKDYLENILNHKMVVLPIADNLLRYMDEAEISKSIISSVASHPYQVISINNWLFSIKNERFIPFASIHPFFCGLREELKRIKDNAFGIKLQPEFQKFYVDDERAFDLYEELERLKIPVLLHCGIELSSPGEVRSSPERIIKVLEKFPSLKVIGAHMGGFLMWKEVLGKLAGKNLYFDTSDSIRVMKRDLLEKFFEKHGFDKIIYGSDFPFAKQKEEIDFIKSLSISEENKQKILFFNVKNLLKICSH